MVRMTVGGKATDFLINTGAEYSVVTTAAAPLRRRQPILLELLGCQRKNLSVCLGLVRWGGHEVIHQFLYMPDCPLPLLGRDLLSKLRVTLTFTKNGILQLALPKTGVPREEEWKLFLTEPDQEIEPVLAKRWPKVWAEDNPPGLAINQAPVLLEVKPGAQPVRPKQYSVPQEALEGIQVHLKHLKYYGIIVPCQSPRNTPSCLFLNQGPKTTGQCRTCAWLTRPQLAFESQKLFVFQWENPETGVTTEYTWIWLPQGFKNSPTIFGEASAHDLRKFTANDLGCVLLQYADDLLLGHHMAVGCAKRTDVLLWHLEDCGYKQVRYLGFTIRKRERSLGTERKQVICNLPEPKIRRQVREFLGFCRLWILSFAVLANPLYNHQAYQELKTKLLSALALGLPDLTKPFMLYVAEREKMAVGVLTQTVGPWPRPVAYLSKQLDGVSKGWPPCLRALAATALLAQEADKLTLGRT
ncbi:Gag-Pol polyprotein [Plecturocebus cupreus]